MGQVMASAMKDTQRELQGEMQEKQLNLMIKTQERMRRVQIAQMIAMQRERLYWIGGVYGLLLAGATAFLAKNKRLPPPLGVPIVLGGVFMAYQYDLCWGNKLERVNKMAEELAKEPHWFNPSMPSDEDVQRLKNPPRPL